MKHPEVQQAIQAFMNRSSRINDTTYEQVRAILKQGYDDGIGVTGIERQLRELFKSYYKVKPGDPDAMTRSKRFAATEVNGVVQTGSLNAWKQAGVRKKEWVSVLDGVTRDPHIDANGEVVDIDQPFVRTGEAMMSPGDPNGSPGNVINCRCDMLPVADL